MKVKMQELIHKKATIVPIFTFHYMLGNKKLYHYLTQDRIIMVTNYL